MRLRRREDGGFYPLRRCAPAPLATRGAKGEGNAARMTGVSDDDKGGGAVTLIADDPTVRCMERTGYPPWMVYGGKNDEEEQETEHE